MPFDQDTAKDVLDHIHGRAAMPMPTDHRLRLLTAMGDESTFGTEVASGGGYVSGTGAPLLELDDATLATPAVSATTAAVTVTSWPRVEDILGGEIWAMLAGVPRRISYGAFDAPISMGIGDTLTIATGDISAEMQ